MTTAGALTTSVAVVFGLTMIVGGLATPACRRPAHVGAAVSVSAIDAIACFGEGVHAPAPRAGRRRAARSGEVGEQLRLEVGGDDRLQPAVEIDGGSRGRATAATRRICTRRSPVSAASYGPIWRDKSLTERWS
jgi:hypothetical protein